MVRQVNHSCNDCVLCRVKGHSVLPAPEQSPVRIFLTIRPSRDIGRCIAKLESLVAPEAVVMIASTHNTEITVAVNLGNKIKSTQALAGLETIADICEKCPEMQPVFCTSFDASLQDVSMETSECVVELGEPPSSNEHNGSSPMKEQANA